MVGIVICWLCSICQMVKLAASASRRISRDRPNPRQYWRMMWSHVLCYPYGQEKWTWLSDHTRVEMTMVHGVLLLMRKLPTLSLYQMWLLLPVCQMVTLAFLASEIQAGNGYVSYLCIISALKRRVIWRMGQRPWEGHLTSPLSSQVAWRRARFGLEPPRIFVASWDWKSTPWYPLLPGIGEGCVF